MRPPDVNGRRSAPVATREQPTVRVSRRPLGSPLPMGFLALAAATTDYATVQLGWLASDQGRIAALGALAMTVPLQALATVIAFLSGDAVSGSAFAVQAGTWAAVGAVTLATPAGAHSPGLGVLLLVSATAQLISAAAAATELTAAAVIMGLAATRFAVTGIAEITPSPGWLQSAGVLGLLLGAAATYAALAFELEAAHHALLPTGRRQPSHPAGDAPS